MVFAYQFHNSQKSYQGKDVSCLDTAESYLEHRVSKIDLILRLNSIFAIKYRLDFNIKVESILWSKMELILNFVIKNRLGFKTKIDKLIFAIKNRLDFKIKFESIFILNRYWNYNNFETNGTPYRLSLGW